ncbi:hypothetical protein ACU4GD_32985 [Cupriavidus basilensis]
MLEAMRGRPGTRRCQTGVSRPARWPKNSPDDADVVQWMLPDAAGCPDAAAGELSLFQLY